MTAFPRLSLIQMPILVLFGFSCQPGRIQEFEPCQRKMVGSQKSQRLIIILNCVKLSRITFPSVHCWFKGFANTMEGQSPAKWCLNMISLTNNSWWIVVWSSFQRPLANWFYYVLLHVGESEPSRSSCSRWVAEHIAPGVVSFFVRSWWRSLIAAVSADASQKW